MPNNISFSNERHKISHRYIEELYHFLSNREAIEKALSDRNEVMLHYEINILWCDLWLFRDPDGSIRFQFFISDIAEISGVMVYND